MTTPTHTPGPWKWFGTDHGIYLATVHHGRRYVMGFKRMGMQGAEPLFQCKGRMVPASDLVRFEVGSSDVRGFKAAKANPNTYRYDITSIDHPDARLIAAAPDLLAVAQKANDWPFEGLEEPSDIERAELPEATANYINDLENFIDAVQYVARAALSKALGEDGTAAPPQEGE